VDWLYFPKLRYVFYAYFNVFPFGSVRNGYIKWKGRKLKEQQILSCYVFVPQPGTMCGIPLLFLHVLHNHHVQVGTKVCLWGRYLDEIYILYGNWFIVTRYSRIWYLSCRNKNCPYSWICFSSLNHIIQIRWMLNDISVNDIYEIKCNANLMQLGNFIDVFLARHVSGTYAHHQEH